MHIFIDESGTFARTVTAGSYCVVAAYIVPESTLPKLIEAIRQFKVHHGFMAKKEVKLRDLNEQQYFELLGLLSKLDAVGIAVGTDSQFNAEADKHREHQAREIEAWVPQMIYPEGRAIVQEQADNVRKLSTQSYVEMIVRVSLVEDVIRYGTLYYAQRKPGTLSTFKWKFDRKDIRENHFESTLKHMTPPLLQTIGLREPFNQLEGANYSKYIENFEYVGDDSWLPTQALLEKSAGKTNIGKIWYQNLAFVDSKDHEGVQAADLIVSGLRRLLRGEFKADLVAAEKLGAVMLRRPKDQPGIRLVMLNEGSSISPPKDVSKRVMHMHDFAKDMLTAATRA